MDAQEDIQEENGEEGGSFDDICVEQLLRLCEENYLELENMRILYGDPCPAGGRRRSAVNLLEIPEDEEIYLIYGNAVGFAVTTSGIYFKFHFSAQGSITWQEFMDSSIRFHRDLESLGMVTGTQGDSPLAALP